MCLGVAVSKNSTPLGPYQDIGHPLLCNTVDPSVGYIGAHQFYDVDGTPYLVWKSDDNSVGKNSMIHIRKLNADGVSFERTEPITTLLTAGYYWEWNIVEGAWMIHRNGYYYLFYSGNFFASIYYAVGVARSKDILGPYEKHGGPGINESILHTNYNEYSEGKNTTFTSPGHCSVVEVN